MKKGFTLIELLVVISIIGILAGLTLVSYSGAQKQTRDTQRKSDLGQYRIALEAYAAANDGEYPIHSTAVTIGTGNLCSASELGGFISECLADPKSPTYDYSYQSDTAGLKYGLWATLETGGYWRVCSDGRSEKVTGVPDVTQCN